MASKVSALAPVREKLVEIQRKMGHEKSVIMDGRDIGTNVLTDADHKFFMTASAEERAQRRYKELIEKGEDVSFEQVLSDINQRDKNDMERELNPLRKADDAIELFAAENAGNTDNAPLVEKPVTFVASVKEKGSIEVHLDAPTGDLLTSIAFDSPNGFTNVYSDPISNIGGTHDLYFVYSDQGVSMQAWRFTESSEPSERRMGDVNADGKFDIADVVLLQKWLLAVPDTKLADWKAANYYNDNRLDVFDLCLMKRKLIYG
jgi:hypothetical protein